MAKALALALFVLLVVAAAPAARAVCNMSNAELDECKAAAAVSNPTPSPTAKCCAILAKADMKCLCTYKDSAMLSFYGIDSHLAMQLPGKCGLPPPPCA